MPRSAAIRASTPRDFNDRVAGNLRVDYLLPSKDLTCAAAVSSGRRAIDPAAKLVWGTPPPCSDHRLVWIDVSCRRSSMPTGQWSDSQ